MMKQEKRQANPPSPLQRTEPKQAKKREALRDGVGKNKIGKVEERIDRHREKKHHRMTMSDRGPTKTEKQTFKGQNT